MQQQNNMPVDHVQRQQTNKQKQQHSFNVQFLSKPEQVSNRTTSQITTNIPPLGFYRPDALPVTRQTASPRK